MRADRRCAAECDPALREGERGVIGAGEVAVNIFGGVVAEGDRVDPVAGADNHRHVAVGTTDVDLAPAIDQIADFGSAQREVSCRRARIGSTDAHRLRGGSGLQRQGAGAADIGAQRYIIRCDG